MMNKFTINFIFLFVIFSLNSYQSLADTEKATVSYARSMKNISDGSKQLSQQVPQQIPQQTPQQTPQHAPKKIKPVITDEMIGKATGAERELPNNTQATEVNNTVNHLITHDDYYIYSANSFLEVDYDGDGFYSTFKVNFDVDVYTSTIDLNREIYAKLYLRSQNGAWIHFYTTDIFTIYADYDDDVIEVATTLYEGYPSDYYDVLIDIYSVDYNELVATISADDSNALYALPFESVDYDPEFIEVETVTLVESGSFSGALLLVLLIVIAYRVKAQSKA